MARWSILIQSLLVASLCVGVERLHADSGQTQSASAPTSRPASIVRVAAIGGINDAGFWKAISERFEQQTGIRVQTIATGNKDGVAELFRRGGIDLITVQSAQVIVGLVADGYASDPQPWVKTELIIVGPQADPAAIKGVVDASAAVRKIIANKSSFIIHGSLGVDEIVRGIVQAGKGQLADGQAVLLLDDHQKRVLQVAADKHAYTLIGGIPFRGGKIGGDGLVELVRGDPLLQRPFVLAVANPRKIADVHVTEARRLAAFLRSDDTQRWIAQFGRAKPDDRPLFFPVSEIPTKNPAAPDALVTVSGEVNHPVAIDAAVWAKLGRHSVRVKDRSGLTVQYEGPLLRDVLGLAGAPLGSHQLRGPNLSLYLVVEAADGYSAVFAMPELDEDFAERSIVLADRRDGRPLDEKDGPVRIIVPQESTPGRWVRRVVRLSVRRAE